MCSTCIACSVKECLDETGKYTDRKNKINPIMHHCRSYHLCVCMLWPLTMLNWLSLQARECKPTLEVLWRLRQSNNFWCFQMTYLSAYYVWYFGYLGCMVYLVLSVFGMGNHSTCDLRTFYFILNQHKSPYKSRFNSNSSLCSTTIL